MFPAYLLRCADGTFEVGSCEDLDKRIATHNRGEGAAWTARRRPMNRRELERLAEHAWDLYEADPRRETLDRLLTEFPELLRPKRHEDSLLYHAVLRGDRTAIRVLRERGLPDRSTGGVESAYLCAATSWGDLDLMREVLTWGLDLDQCHAPNNPLRDAVDRGATDRVEMLLDAGARIDRHSQGWSVLHAAAARDDPAMIALLVRRGAAVDDRDSDGTERTPLMAAARSGALGAARALLALGASPHLRAGDGRTAAEIATEHGHDELARLLGAEH